jgi:hypothetical protein
MSMIDRVAAWLPFRSIPDAEYEGRLNEKIALIDVEIVVLDNRIASLRQQSDSQDKLTP